MIRVVLPSQLSTLARCDREVHLELAGTPSVCQLLDALEAAHPVLVGAIRDARSGQRRAFVRYFACERDLSHDPPDTTLPEAVLGGTEPFVVLGAIAGG
ncbi:MAG: MoaD/ThiS family protein [Actinomycetota bacterium]|nr:MoaD/ThiS family protein [Actinomycetota bacterium]